MFSEKGMKPDPQKIQEIRQMPAPENKKGSQSFLELSNYMKRFIHDYIVHKHIIYENYCRRIKITYGQKHMSWFLTILNNHLVVKVLLPILTTMERHLFTQTLVLTEFRWSFCRNRETKQIVKSLRIVQGPSPLPKKIVHNWNANA